ncbi:hypothetical protein NONO_c35340 [Nocardia nova SH22a]|uniref:Uncharacterized protein n=1 Tax=Nocardia nova SH22a TaxID=1415166 RepID=W5TM44_9NOCA|nr:AAA family ATPase [Nocardia nova]AHH18321.1 hypothetical protein NONO_c35340 [Nocardia nova SH22a]
MTDPNHPAGAPPPGEPFAALHETHSGVVVLYGDRAYKTKKPIVTDFLDFGGRAEREQACAREIRLNRRLAPDIYLGLGHLVESEGDDGEPVVVMRRLPDAHRLSRLLERSDTARSTLGGLAQKLARFHDSADRGLSIDRDGTMDALRARWWSLLDGVTEPPASASVVRRIGELAMRYLDRRVPLFDDRIAEHRIIDGHGDLRADDIFVLADGFRILDCLDFDDSLRHIDRVDDIAFLAMDLEFLGHPELAESFVADYAIAARDPAPPSLRHHYTAYRALVRAKVNCIRHRQGDGDAADHVRRHLDIALAHLQTGAVRLALLGGLPGTGKSTIADHVGRATDAVVLSSDHVRTRLRSGGLVSAGTGHYGAEGYSPAAKSRVYDELLAQARTHLAHGRSVVLDASWTAASHRERAAALAADLRAELIEIRCAAPQLVAAQRISDRRDSESEASPAIAEEMARDAEAWPSATVLDTTGPLADTVERALGVWRTLS